MDKKIIVHDFIEIPDIKFNSKSFGITSKVKYPNVELIKTDNPISDAIICLRVSLNQTAITLYNYISEQKIKYKIESIELYDKPIFVKSYNEYELNLITILQMLKERNITNISLHVDDYLEDVLKNIKKYKDLITFLDISIYGTCMKENPSITSLLTYKINNAMLAKNVSFLQSNNITLSIQANSICEKVNNITNTFGAVIWMIDFLFQISLSNVQRIFVDMSDINNKYAYDIFKTVTRDNVSFLNFTTETNLMPNISIYCTRNLKEQFITVIHKDEVLEEVMLEVDLQNNNNATITILSNDETITGTQTIKTREETIKNENSKYTVYVKKNTVVIINIPFMSGGAFFPNINNEDEKNALVTLRPEANEYDSIPTTMTIDEFKKNYQPYM
jgi:hypothetical protein